MNFWSQERSELCSDSHNGNCFPFMSTVDLAVHRKWQVSLWFTLFHFAIFCFWVLCKFRELKKPTIKYNTEQCEAIQYTNAVFQYGVSSILALVFCIVHFVRSFWLRLLLPGFHLSWTCQCQCRLRVVQTVELHRFPHYFGPISELLGTIHECRQTDVLRSRLHRL